MEPPFSHRAISHTGNKTGPLFTRSSGPNPFAFNLPPELEAHEPPEARGLERDGVRMLVSWVTGPRIIHSTFRKLEDYLAPGDVLVINTSKTIKAAVEARLADGTRVELHFSTRLPSGKWIVELRQPESAGGGPFLMAHAGEPLILPDDGRVTLVAPFQTIAPGAGDRTHPGARLWVAEVATPQAIESFLDARGFPIRYKHVSQHWPITTYQTVYADEPGSAEMPSAGRAFSQRILDGLRNRGIQVVPLVLHAGVSSQEDGELPPPERYRVPAPTAQAVNRAHRSGRRVIAVGTTVIRALETVTGQDGMVQAGDGWTDLVITPRRPIRSVNGLLTGFHEPRSTHLLMLSALAGIKIIKGAYLEALRSGYLWHEFGDLHLILP